MVTRKHRRASELLQSGLSQRDTAALMDVTPRTIRNWKAEGKLPGLEENGRKDEEEVSLSDARRRKEAALAEKHELDAARQRGELIEKDHLVDVLLRVRRVADALPARMCQDVAELLDLETREALPLLEEVADRIIERVRAELESWVREELEARTDTPLPEDVPHRQWLVKAGVETVEELEERADLTELRGIGPARAAKLRGWLDG